MKLQSENKKPNTQNFHFRIDSDTKKKINYLPNLGKVE